MRETSPALPETSPLHQCPLCGFRFGEFAQGHCGVCPSLQKTCAEEPRCPRCGYRFPGESFFLNLARRLFRGR